MLFDARDRLARSVYTRSHLCCEEECGHDQAHVGTIGRIQARPNDFGDALQPTHVVQRNEQITEAS